MVLVPDLVEVGSPLLMLCAQCGQPATTLAKDVVSTNFVDADLWRWRNHGDLPMLCTACAAAYKDRALRVWPHRLDMTTSDRTRLAPSELGALLDEPLTPTICVVVPIGGKKHLWHRAEGAHVVSDHIVHRWLRDDCDRLDAVRHLRQIGFGEAAMAEPAPRWAVMRNLSASQRSEVIDLWASTDRWRQQLRPLLDVALRATRKDKEPS